MIENEEFMLDVVNNLCLHILSLDANYHRPDSVTWLEQSKQHGQVSLSRLSYYDLIYVELNLKSKLLCNKDRIKIRASKKWM